MQHVTRRTCTCTYMYSHPSSGGLDSAVLLASEAARDTVLPIYVEVGLAWEPAERQMLALLLAAPVFQRNVRALETLTFDMRDVYPPTHWAITGTPPAYDTPDEDVYLAGRNLVLLTKAGVVAAKRRASRIALGPLAGNPFPDATPEFFAAMARALSLGLALRDCRGNAVRRSAQGGRDPAGRVARRAARAHAVLHESTDGEPRKDAFPCTAGSVASAASGATASRPPASTT